MSPQPPRILAIETSGAAGSIAVARGETLCIETPLDASTRHAADLMAAIDRAWRSQDWASDSLAECHVSIGPGSFTGLRVAVTTARSLALALSARLVAVPSLDVVARSALTHLDEGEYLAAMLDAKRGQVFAALYQRRAEEMTPLSGPHLIEPEMWLAGLPRPCRITGEGIAYHAAACARSGLPLIPPAARIPHARDVYRLGWVLAQAGRYASTRDLTPLYVRRPEAEELWERRQAESPAPHRL